MAESNRDWNWCKSAVIEASSSAYEISITARQALEQSPTRRRHQPHKVTHCDVLTIVCREAQEDAVAYAGRVCCR